MDFKSIKDKINNYDISDWLKEKSYQVMNGWIVIDFEITETNNELTVDGVAYDIEELDGVETIKDFIDYFEEKNYDKSNYELDRFSFLTIEKSRAEKGDN